MDNMISLTGITHMRVSHRPRVVGHVADIDKVVDLHYITFLFNNFLFDNHPEQI
jgi:hypothetical protein